MYVGNLICTLFWRTFRTLSHCIITALWDCEQLSQVWTMLYCIHALYHCVMCIVLANAESIHGSQSRNSLDCRTKHTRMICAFSFLKRTYLLLLLFYRVSAYASPVLAIAGMSVRPSVWPSVTRWNWVKMTQARITKSSLMDSPTTLVFEITNSSRNSKGFTPIEGVKWEWGGKKFAIFNQ